MEATCNPKGVHEASYMHMYIRYTLYIIKHGSKGSKIYFDRFLLYNYFCTSSKKACLKLKKCRMCPATFIMYVNMKHETNIRLSCHRKTYVKFHSVNKRYVKFHYETKRYTKFHSKTNGYPN
jgi:hypothetical protein